MNNDSTHDDLMKELENLKTENKILRDSLVEYVPDEPENREKGFEKTLSDMTGMLNAIIEHGKEQLDPGAEKVSAFFRRQMETNPVPVLLAAFGAGYLLSRALDRK